MPVCDGFESTKLIRDLEKRSKIITDPPRPPNPAYIIALTGQATERDKTMTFASGMDHFMTKPMSFVQLKALLDEWEQTTTGR